MPAFEGVEYVGFRVPPNDTALVVKWIDHQRANYLRSEDRCGFEWCGDARRGTLLALAILSDVLGDEHAHEASADFKRAVIDRLPRGGFRITAAAIDKWADQLAQKGQGMTFPIQGMEALDIRGDGFSVYMPEELPPLRWIEDPSLDTHLGDDSDAPF